MGIRKFNFSIFFLNWIISVIDGAKITKFGTPLVEGHSEGTVSQIFNLGPSFYFIFDINSETRFPPNECYQQDHKVRKTY